MLDSLALSKGLTCAMVHAYCFCSYHYRFCPVQAILGYLNWVAPCLVKTNVQAVHASLMGLVASDSPNSLSMALMPAFCYQRGQLWLSENMALKALANQNLNVDKIWMLPFKERLDSRDGRPATLVGRFLIGLGARESDSHWQHCSILDKRRTEEATQLPSSCMVILEDYDDVALPSVCSGMDHNHPNALRGPKRYEQIGVDGCLKMLDATLDGLSKAPAVNGFLLVEANVTCGDMLEAFIHKVASSTLPSYYFGVVADSGAIEWVVNHVVDCLTNKLKDGVLSIPGVDKHIPESVDIGPLEKPQMKVLIMEAESNLLKVPEVILKEWGVHPVFGQALSKVLLEKQNELGYDKPFQSTEVTTTSETPDPFGKRKATAGSSPPAKKLKSVDPLDIVKTETLNEAVLLNVKMASIKGPVTVELRMGNGIAIRNAGTNPVTLKAGSVVLGFGKIAWKRLLDEDMVKIDCRGVAHKCVRWWFEFETNARVCVFVFVYGFVHVNVNVMVCVCRCLFATGIADKGLTCISTQHIVTTSPGNKQSFRKLRVTRTCWFPFQTQRSSSC